MIRARLRRLQIGLRLLIDRFRVRGIDFRDEIALLHRRALVDGEPHDLPARFRFHVDRGQCHDLPGCGDRSNKLALLHRRVAIFDLGRAVGARTKHHKAAQEQGDENSPDDVNALHEWTFLITRIHPG